MEHKENGKVAFHDGYCTVNFDFSTLKCGKFDLIAKFWSSTRKRLKEETELDVIATFHQDKEGVHGIFIPSRVDTNGGEYSKETFDKLWSKVEEDDILQLYVDIFIEALERFKSCVLYEEYSWMVGTAVEDDDDSSFHKLTNHFLLGIGLKTPEDERKKEAFARELARAKAEAEAKNKKISK